MTISERLGAIGSVLDARVACQSAAAPGAKPLGRCWPALAVSGVVLAVLVYMNTLLGLNEEMTGTVYLHPYQLLALDASTPRWSECADGFFVQTIKPVFGVCIQGQPLPLLSKSYIPAWSYWPLWWIGSHIPHYVPILVNVIPALIAATLLCLMAVQVGRPDGPLQVVDHGQQVADEREACVAAFFFHRAQHAFADVLQLRLQPQIAVPRLVQLGLQQGHRG